MASWFIIITIIFNGSMRRSSASLHPLSAGIPGASFWPSPRQMPGPFLSPWDADQPAATTRNVVGPSASSIHEAPSLRVSGEQDQRQENEPHVHTAAADAHGLCRQQISFESLLATAHWTHSPTSDSQGFSEETWYQSYCLSQIPGQSPSLTSIEQDWKHQGPEDLDFCPPAQETTAPHPMIQ